MAWKYSLGFKLSQRGRERLRAWLTSRGYTITEEGWDYVMTVSRISAVDKIAFINNTILLLSLEEQV